MNISKRLKILTDSGRTVFTPVDFRILWKDNALNAKINAIRMVENKLILRLAKGYYALNSRYNRHELANRIITPSYVSFQTALGFAGVSFQKRSEIGSVSLLNYRKSIDGIVYTYVSMKKELFYNREGIVEREGAYVALPERAVLDSYYFGYLPDIDNFEKINKSYLIKLSLLYPKSVQKKAVL